MIDLLCACRPSVAAGSCAGLIVGKNMRKPHTLLICKHKILSLIFSNGNSIIPCSLNPKWHIQNQYARAFNRLPQRPHRSISSQFPFRSIKMSLRSIKIYLSMSHFQKYQTYSTPWSEPISAFKNEWPHLLFPLISGKKKNLHTLRKDLNHWKKHIPSNYWEINTPVLLRHIRYPPL